MRLLERCDGVLAKVEQGLVVFLATAFVVTMLVTILGRNLFQQSFQTLLELMPAFVVWLALLGASLGIRQDKHIKLELVLRLLGPRLQRYARSFAELFSAVVSLILLVASVRFVRAEIGTFGGIGALAVIFPLFFGMSAFRFALRAVKHAGAA